ncbi:transglycosylase SLT domain-containing protein [Luteimonas aestuarii]
MELMGCANLAVPPDVMRHVVRIESSFNPYAIGVVGGRLVRQPRNLPEAVSTARMLESEGYNFSLGLAQVNRYNLASYGLDSYEKAFQACPNLQAGARILAECYHRSGGDWGKAFSCYYSGNFVTGFRHGYVQKVLASWHSEAGSLSAPAVALVERRTGRAVAASVAADLPSLVMRRIQEAAAPPVPALRVQPPSAIAPAVSTMLPQPASVAMPSRHAAPGPVIAGALVPDGDAPVRLQPMGAVSSQIPSLPPTSPQQQAVADLPAVAPSPRRDEAFVF